MRTLCVVSTTPPAFSGATKSWMRLAPRFPENGIVMETLYCSTKGKMVLARDDGSRQTIAPFPGTRAGSYVGTILTTAKVLLRERGRYGCVFFLSTPDSLFLAILLKPLHRLRMVYRMTMLGEDDPLALAATGRFGWLRARILRGIDAVVCINPAMAESSLEAGLASHRVVTILQGTDVEHFRPTDPRTRLAVRTREGLAHDAQVVLFCGALVERKGVDLLLDAWARVRASHPGACLVLAGPDGGHDDPHNRFQQRMREQASRPEYGDSVRFLGYREDIGDLMKAADIFVLPSRMEGTPNVLLEAMATGLPVVISDLPGVSEVFVRDGVEAFIAPQNDAARIGESLQRLLDDPSLARQFGARARARAVANFSHVGVARQYASAFRGTATDPTANETYG